MFGMSTTNDQQGSTTRQEPATIFVSLELSRVRWLVTWIFHGSNKMSKASLAAGNGDALLVLLAQIRTKAERSQRLAGKIIVVREARLDEFWIHRLLEGHGMEATSQSRIRRGSTPVAPTEERCDRRRDATARSDGLEAWRSAGLFHGHAAQGQRTRRNVAWCGSVKMLVAERIRETNRIRGLLASQGVADHKPLRRARPQRRGLDPIANPNPAAAGQLNFDQPDRRRR